MSKIKFIDVMTVLFIPILLVGILFPVITSMSPFDRMISSTVYIKSLDGGWSGSGVIVDKDKGYIVTASHVVDWSTNFRIVLSDGREFMAIDCYYETITDVGFVQIDANDLIDVEIGNSDKLELGDKTYIIGAPYGLTLFPTMTFGIMSGLSRNIPFFGEKQVIQSDAGSWPGNSGGGLFNLKGELIGILVGGYIGADNIGICIPSNIVKLSLKKYEAEKELMLAK